MKEDYLYSKILELFDDKYHIFLKYAIQDGSMREIDVLCVQKQNDDPEMLAIEAKVSNWKVAFRQAFSRLFYIDRSYIALPFQYATSVNYTTLKKNGVGLILVDGSAKVIIDAKKTDKTLQWRREMLLKDIMRKLRENETHDLL
jgi:hypothetical protein